MLALMFTVYEDILAFFADTLIPGGGEVAQLWLITAIVVAVLGTGMALGFKAYRKSASGIAKNKIWTRRESWLLVFAGLFPIFVILLVIWYSSNDFFNYAFLLSGTLFSWLVYFFGMVMGHLVSPWKRELI